MRIGEGLKYASSLSHTLINRRILSHPFKYLHPGAPLNNNPQCVILRRTPASNTVIVKRQARYRLRPGSCWFGKGSEEADGILVAGIKPGWSQMTDSRPGNRVIEAENELAAVFPG